MAATGRCPEGVFDLLAGVDRWVLRAVARAALLTDVYPPFRPDMSGGEPIGTRSAVPWMAERPL
ncbi:hypothetical protein [Streptomyces sp. NPDC058964]|uniref:hypothetical protein n=1 Tax=Streptomyces sp. NPDC058964 TaxID=3346681 RepID=UPI0036BDAAE6